jgi:hypothetical protein
MIADIWFDPSCPYTWVTARWLIEVTKVRPVEIRWNVMSLSVLNEGGDEDPEGDTEGYLWYPVRVCAAVRQHYGHEALGRFYAELWRESTGDWLVDFGRALERAGLSKDLANAGEEFDDAVRASHAEAMKLLGPHVGTPIIAVKESAIAFFGPVISEVPVGEHAGQLWDGTLLVAATPGFHELKAAAHAPPRP